MSSFVCALVRTSTFALVIFASCLRAENQVAPISAAFSPNSAWRAVESVTSSADGTKLEIVTGNTARVMVLTDASPKSPHLRSSANVTDLVLSTEYLFTAGTKAGIYLNSTYRLQLDGGGAGTIGPIVSRDPSGPDTFIAPAQRADGSPGVWHRLEARLRASRYGEAGNKTQEALLLEVKIDGVVVHTNVRVPNWSRGTETEWDNGRGNTTFAATAGNLAVRDFSLRRADYRELTLPEKNGGATNQAKLIDYVQQGAELFKGLGCIECHATQRGDDSQKTGPNLFGLFRVEPRDREIEAGEGKRFTVKADRAYLLRSLRSPFDELAVHEHGPNQGKPYLPAMPPILPAVATDAQIDAIGAYLATLNEPAHQGPVAMFVKETGLENYDPMKDRLQLLVDRVVRIQRGPMPGVSGRAIHVGLPSGINYTFDPRRLAIVQVWQGGFLDMSGEFLNRGGAGLRQGYESREIKLGNLGALMAPLNAAGKPVDLSFVSPVFRDFATARAALNDTRDLPARLAEVDAQFFGYERDSRDAKAAPAFSYRIGRNTLALRPEFADDGVVRFILSGYLDEPQSFAINEAVLGTIQISAGKIEAGRWVLPAGSYHQATATGRIGLAAQVWRPTPSDFNHVRQPLVTEPAKPDIPRGYSAESYLAPKDNYGRDMLFEALGMDLASDQTLVVATRTAGIWRLQGGEWRPFAEGLFDSLGVKVEDAHGLVVVASQKAELTRLSDINGDGVADKYETMNDAFLYTGNYHAYMHGPIRIPDGDYLIALNQNHPGDFDGEYKAGGKYMGTSGGYRGWAMRVPGKGGYELFADGLRSPASLGVAPDGRLWYADNQGEFMATSKLFVLKPGAFYGNPVGLVDRPGMTPESPGIAWDKVKGTRENAVVLFPQGRLANSPGNPAWDTTGGRFGPFGGQMFLGDQTQSNLMRVTTERVGAHEQGAAINFGTQFASGIMRPLFLPDGSLLLGQTGRGWQAKGGHVTSLQHLRWDGKTVAPAMHHVSAVPGGFEIVFTTAVPSDQTNDQLAAALAIKSWVYRDAPDYGSPELDEQAEAVKSISLNADRTALRVTLAKTEHAPVHSEQTARVYLITVDGRKVWNEAGPGFAAFYTLYEFPR